MKATIIQPRIIEFDDYKEFCKYLKQYKMHKDNAVYKRGKYLLPCDRSPFVNYIVADYDIPGAGVVEEIRIRLNKVDLLHLRKNFRPK